MRSTAARPGSARRKDVAAEDVVTGDAKHGRWFEHEEVLRSGGATRSIDRSGERLWHRSLGRGLGGTWEVPTRTKTRGSVSTRSRCSSGVGRSWLSRPPVLWAAVAHGGGGYLGLDTVPWLGRGDGRGTRC